MSSVSERFHNWMTVITFAEAGEWETARAMMPQTQPDATVSPMEKTFMAAAFAEAGEWETACALAPSPQLDATISPTEKVFMAVAFAEADLHDEAMRIMNTDKPQRRSKGSFLSGIGLKGVRVTYAVLAARGA